MLPPINPSDLGDEKSVLIDALFIPYLTGLLAQLTDPNAFEGDEEEQKDSIELIKNLIRTIQEA